MTIEIIDDQKVLDAIKTILFYIGEDPSREGLLDTPNRVLNSYKELFAGYHIDIGSILNKKFHIDKSNGGMVISKKIKFHSFCEHHMLPFFGEVDFAYLPKDYVIGISKISRVVEFFARRLQIQEKLTIEICEAIQNYLEPYGVAARIIASHSCMSMRGVNKDNSIMQTTSFLGSFQDNIELQNQFINSL